MSLRKSLGFTLIELLVAIAIIALLFGVVISNTGILRSTSDDAKMKADIAKIQSALQNYYADNNYFPSSGSGGFVLDGNNPTLTFTSNVGAAPQPTPPATPRPAKTYLREVPVDLSTSYCYQAVKSVQSTAADCDNDPVSTDACHYYYISAKLTNSTIEGTLPEFANCGDSTKNYMVTP